MGPTLIFLRSLFWFASTILKTKPKKFCVVPDYTTSYYSNLEFLYCSILGLILVLSVHRHYPRWTWLPLLLVLQIRMRNYGMTMR